MNRTLYFILCLGLAATTTSANGQDIPSLQVRMDPSFHSDDPILEARLHKQRNTKVSVNAPAALPTLKVITNNNPSEGNIFLSNFQFTTFEQTNTYRFILNKSGELIYSIEGTPNHFNDFKPNPNGTYSYFDVDNEVFYITDTNFTIIDSLRAANGLITDGHEFLLTPEGHYIILAENDQLTDMSKIVEGGDTAATVLGPVIQEFDANKQLIFEWKGLEHFKITDATHEDLTKKTIDFCHPNAIDLDTDGNLLLSSRHMDEITKIDRKTGAIIWRMGGKNNQFTFIDDSIPFSHQHAIRRTAAGTYTLFDNGNFRDTALGRFSRAVEYELDQVNKTARLVWQYRRTPDAYGMAMGNVQRLPNGNTIIGWGACQSVAISEVTQGGDEAFELSIANAHYSYRAFKFDTSYIHSGTVATVDPSIGSLSDLFITCSSNPVTGSAQISCHTAKQTQLELSLYNIGGQKMQQLFNGQTTSTSTTIPFSTAEIPAGVYYISAVAGGVSAHQKIVISK